MAIWDDVIPDQDKKVYEAAGWGMPCGFGQRPALILIDVIYNFVGDPEEPILESIKKWRYSCGTIGWEGVRATAGLLKVARAKDIPILYTTWERRDDFLDMGRWNDKNFRVDDEIDAIGHHGNDIVKEVAPGEHEIVFVKKKPSAFFGTSLASYLIDFGVDTLILTGTTTSGAGGMCLGPGPAQPQGQPFRYQREVWGCHSDFGGKDQPGGIAGRAFRGSVAAAVEAATGGGEMKEPNFESYHIRKWYRYVDTACANETGIPADGPPVIKVIVAAAVQNPFAGAFHNDLSAVVGDSEKLGAAFGEQLLKALDGTPAQSYGKACVVGVDGEYEHGNAFLTTAFANPIREALGGGAAWVPSTGKTGGPGTTIDVPLACKDALYVRSHYDTITAMFPDAPLRDEVIVIVAAATRGRIRARLGGLAYEDRKGDDGLR